MDSKIAQKVVDLTKQITQKRTIICDRLCHMYVCPGISEFAAEFQGMGRGILYGHLYLTTEGLEFYSYTFLSQEEKNAFLLGNKQDVSEKLLEYERVYIPIDAIDQVKGFAINLKIKTTKKGKFAFRVIPQVDFIYAIRALKSGEELEKIRDFAAKKRVSPLFYPYYMNPMLNRKVSSETARQVIDLTTEIEKKRTIICDYMTAINMKKPWGHLYLTKVEETYYLEYYDYGLSGTQESFFIAFDDIEDVVVKWNAYLVVKSKEGSKMTFCIAQGGITKMESEIKRLLGNN